LSTRARTTSTKSLSESSARPTTYTEHALVEVTPQNLATVDQVDMDAQDRHVLAAVLSADADILLTDNACQWMAARHIELLTSAQLLTRLAGEFLDVPAGQIIRNLAQILKAEQEPDAVCQPIARDHRATASRSRRECIESSSRMSEVCRIRRALSGGDRTLTSPFHQLSLHL
jgi:hypothetical protein